jgi:hypothetical protein
VKREMQVLLDLLAHRVLRAQKVLLDLQRLLRTCFELCVSTALPQRAEESVTRTRCLSSGTVAPGEVVS